MAQFFYLISDNHPLLGIEQNAAQVRGSKVARLMNSSPDRDGMFEGVREIRLKSRASVITGKFYTVEDAIDACGFGLFQIELSLITGFAWMSNSMEIMVVSIIGPELVCEWLLSPTSEALLSTVIFLGMGVGAPIIGSIGDRHGRKFSIIYSTVWALFYGLLTSIAPNYAWLLTLRCFLGFGIGGVPQCRVTYYAEFLPTKRRGKCLVMIELAWALGAMMEVILAMVILIPFGWRWWLVSSAVPLAAFLAICMWLPESPCYDVAAGNAERARQTLERVAKANSAELPPGRLEAKHQIEQGTCKDLFVAERFGGAFSYYGVILMSTQLISLGSTCTDATKSRFEANQCVAGCRRLDTDDYYRLLWTSIAELPGLLVAAWLIDLVGRRVTMSLGYLCFGIMCFVHIACIHGNSLVATLFIARSVVSAAFQVIYVYTPEVYPTKIRGLAIGIGCGCSRLGALLTPFVATNLIEWSIPTSLMVYGIMGTLTAFACTLLPIETMGKKF
ncbi:hypothetical protein CAPTEDRAFT_215670 [Capitella teleta]|uniref:Major facilitator superfamily (MFS) profile domain-containing protein n=1 Tax=Capitella teleta TaxID=283909 RepID=R7TTT2_CAPTE|nr:hypothetical protein CAPTEDRAFT_215670 [Capitella teleta]|eukprot:ELT97027.1 hypothetical protein CAPTEDRAFT_215670 [Capitella teleta]